MPRRPHGHDNLCTNSLALLGAGMAVHDGRALPIAPMFHIAALSVMLGYRNQPEQSAAALRAAAVWIQAAQPASGRFAQRRPAHAA